LAVAGSAQAIVTRNKRDFRGAGRAKPRLQLLAKARGESVRGR